MMEASIVVSIYQKLESQGIKIWIDGGWGVDALLGSQTRPHKDLDIAIEWNNVAKMKKVLNLQGYVQLREDNQYNFVLGDAQGHEIDVHAFVFDQFNTVVGGALYPTASLTGTGFIDGIMVHCISPEYLIQFHSGYTLKEKDFHDVSALCKKFNIPLPAEYASFLKK